MMLLEYTDRVDHTIVPQGQQCFLSSQHLASVRSQQAKLPSGNAGHRVQLTKHHLEGSSEDALKFPTRSSASVKVNNT